jgi:hypothetical protein
VPQAVAASSSTAITKPAAMCGMRTMGPSDDEIPNPVPSRQSAELYH